MFLNHTVNSKFRKLVLVYGLIQAILGTDFNSAFAQQDYRSHDVDEINENCPAPAIRNDLPQGEPSTCNLGVAFGTNRTLNLYQRIALPETRRDIDALQSNTQLSDRLRQSTEWTRDVLNQPNLAQELSENPCLRQILTNPTTNLMTVLFKAPAGVGEGYSVGEHSGRVLETFRERRRTLENRSQNDIPESEIGFFEKLLLLHDIGKGFSALLHQHRLEEEFSAPLIYRLFLAMEYPQPQAELARELIRYHKLLGSVSQGHVNLSLALAHLRTGAQAARVPVASFYRYLENLFIADAASYPRVRERAFAMVDDGLFPTSESFFSFRRMVLTPETSLPIRAGSDRLDTENHSQCPPTSPIISRPSVNQSQPTLRSVSNPVVIQPRMQPSSRPFTRPGVQAQSMWNRVSSRFSSWISRQWDLLRDIYSR